MHSLGTSNLARMIKQAQDQVTESSRTTPHNFLPGQVTLDWPSVTILKREPVHKPDLELLQSKIDRFDELKKEIKDIKENRPVTRIPRKSVQVCIRARTED